MNMKMKPPTVEQHASPPPGAGDSSANPAPAAQVERSVYCSHGIHTGHFPVAGLTVAEARRTLTHLLNIDPEAAAVIAGQIVDENTVIGNDVGMLSFVKPSAIKGMPAECITIQGRSVRVAGGDGGEQQGEAIRFVEAIHGASVRGLDDIPLPKNVAWKVDAGPLSVCILQLEPALRRMNIAADGPNSHGPQARYVPRRLATPYVILKVPFLKGTIVQRCELFYRNEPLRHIDDPLFWSNLLNVSPNSYSCRAWICTQYLYSENPRAGIVAGLDALLKHLWGAGNNRSSEANEGASCFSKAVAERVDPRVIDFDRWEQESVKDPRFVLSVKWRPVGTTVRQLIDAELQYHRVKRDLGATAELVNVFLGSNGRNGHRQQQ